MSTLVSPHGGTLVDRFAPESGRPDLLAHLPTLPHIQMDAREASDLELLATGAASPLEGFLGREDYRGVVESMRLRSGVVWPLPLTLAVPDDLRARIGPGAEVALLDPEGRPRGLLRVEEVFERDPLEEARHTLKTEDPAHPGVAYLLSRPRHLAGGKVTALPLPENLPFARHRLTPRELRAEIQRRGWKRVAGFQTRNPIHRAHEHLTKLALELCDGLVIHPLVGETKNDDLPAAVRFRVYETLIARYYPPARTLLAAFPAAMRYAGPREAIFHALLRKNYGIGHLCVGRDHAGVGKFYGPLEAQEVFDQFAPEELGVQPLKFDPTFHCKACGNLASLRTCPHGPEDRLELSGTRVREILRSGGSLPPEFTRPETAEILRAHYLQEVGVGPSAVVAAAAALQAAAARGGSRQAAGTAGSSRGCIVWFTGLSGAGKSTLSQALKAAAGAHQAVEVLDGDEVRAYLSRGLGFSREDRDTNIRRIGYVARLLARHGVMAVAAAISPYREVRDEIRGLAEAEGIAFVEIYLQAEIEALAARDAKGLYRKALAGELPHFTGVSDPYEPPRSPDLLLRTDQEAAERSLARLLAFLEERGAIPTAVAPAPGPGATVSPP